MSRLSDTSFLQKPVNRRSKKRNFLVFLILLKVFITFIVFIKIKYGLKDASIDDENPVVKNDFEWLRNRNFLPFFVKPERDSAIVVPTNMNSYEERDFVACFVMSAPRNSHMRDAVRKTWGKSIKAIFLLGKTDNEATNNLLAEEAHEFNDIIIEDFVDSYVNLTIKTAFALKNFLKHFNTSKYFFKIDDDAFLNVEGLYDLLENAPENSLVGQKERQSKPIRDKKHRWYIPEFIFDADIFPPYFVGLSYVIPGHLVESIYRASMTLPYVTLEDVFFTGVVAGKLLNYNLYDTRKFQVGEIKDINPCLFLQYVTVHKISPENLVKLWEMIEGNVKC